jgi:hypothetical protein
MNGDRTAGPIVRQPSEISADNGTVNDLHDSASVTAARAQLDHGMRDGAAVAYVQYVWRLDLLDARAAVSAAHVLDRRDDHGVALPRDVMGPPWSADPASDSLR